MLLLEVLLFLLLCALALGWASRRFGLPYPIALVVGGGLLGFIPRLPQLDFDPQFLLVLVLPPILYQAALLTSWRDFKANLRTTRDRKSTRLNSSHDQISYAVFCLKKKKKKKKQHRVE